MHTLQINDDTYQVPADWDELTVPQLEYLARISQADQPVEQFKLLALLRCLGARIDGRGRVRIGKKAYTLDAERMNRLADVMGWTMERGKKRYTLTFRRTVNPYPTLQVRRHRLTGPDDNLFDITFEQYMYLQTYLDAAAADPAQMDNVLACLWHTGQRFDINRLEHDARLIHHLRDVTKMIMTWFVMGSIRYLSDSFPRVFGDGGGQGFGNVFDSQLRLLDSLAAHDMTKKDSVRKGLFLDAIYSMDERLRIQEEAEKKM